MTLLVSGNSISIKNGQGTTKFTSDNKLVYQKAYQTGTVNLTSGISWSVPFFTLSNNEFLITTIKIISATGRADYIDNLKNTEMPANGGVIVDFYPRPEQNQGAADIEILGVDCFNSQLWFKTIRYAYDGIVSSGTTSISLTYTARIWSYL